VNVLSSNILTGILISPFVCGAEAPPRLCDPPCPEEQAGIGPISQTPELSTMNDFMSVDWIAQDPTGYPGRPTCY
jgi:hypothetical protein